MSAEKLITDHIDIWTSAVQAKSASGRGSSKKRELYGIKKLRELILELAVRGKLVPQDPNDEPASVLLERIAVEKAQLVKEKKIKKSKPPSKISNEDEPFVLPQGWAWSRLGNAGIGATGKTPSTKQTEFFEGTLPFVGPGQITQNGQLLEAEKFLSSEGLLHSTEAVQGDILMVCIGGSIGKAAIATQTIGFNQQINALRPLIMESEYLYAAVSTNSFYEGLLDKATGSATPIINRGKWEELLVPIAPLSEQHRIVAKVDELMALCDQLEQQTYASLDAHQVLVETLLATLTNSQDATELMANWSRISEHFDTLFTTELSIDQLKQTILQLAVMGKLVAQDPNDEPAAKLLERIAEEKAQLVKEKKIKKQKALPPISEDEKPFELPSGWEFAHMQDLCSLITDGTHQTPKYTDDGRPFISAQCVKPFKFMPQHCRYVSEEHYQAYIKNRKPEFEDILLSRVGAGIGEAAVIDSDIEFAIYVSTGLLKPHKSQIHARYLELWLNSPIGRGFSERNTLGKGVSQGNLNLTLIRSFIVSLPPIKEQLRIVAKFRELNEMCDQLIERLRDSQQTQLQLTDAIVEQAL
ncbi:restriction endonuclease subunit S [Vibrio vulnificus]|uniref:restriction endonuclease subunit S n=1 Tax=Vibrio vulnificus TaxID=672 RepID=UPI0010293194|nr:restriction endonuclease subunit S [Vibrio vulnificus]RZP65282.1 restriction endonuclease subunit S [Vibrio vulnificus]